MHQHKAIGIDLAKRVFQVCIVDTRNQKVHVNKALKRREVLDFLRQQPPCRVFMQEQSGCRVSEQDSKNRLGGSAQLSVLL